MSALRVTVVGAGAFGRNHLRVYRELETTHPDLVQLTSFVEPEPSRRADFAARYSIPGFATVEQMLASGALPQAASICVPTVHHAAIAEQLLLAGVDVLIEKPFAASLAEADHILTLARMRGRIVTVGHLERFNPAVTATFAKLNRPMFFEAHRLSVFTQRSLDVDVVLDLMIHDLDIVLALASSHVREVRAVGLPILSRKVDIANVRVEFESGCVANFTASRVSTEQVRKLRLFQPHQYLSLDFARQELLSIVVDPAATSSLAIATPSLDLPMASMEDPATRLADAVPVSPAKAPTRRSGQPEPQDRSSGELPVPAATERFAATSPPTPIVGPAHPSAGLSLTKADLPKREPLRLEIEDFLNAVRNRTQPRITAEAGRAALSLALEINARIASHAHRAGLV